MIIETVILDYLIERLDVPVLMQRDTGENKAYVLIEKTGGGLLNQICSATVAIQSYAPDMYGAAVLNEDVKAAMKDIVTLGNISRCALDTDYNFTDTSREEYRYQAVFLLTYYQEGE